MRTSPEIKHVVVLVLVAKCVFLLYSPITFYISDFYSEAYIVNRPYPPDEEIGWWSTLKTWDAMHHLRLADLGYVGHSLSNAFMPLFPLAIYALKVITFDSGLAAGLILSNVFSLVAFVYLFLLVKRLHNATVAFRAVVYALVFPTGFFFTRIYADSLFLLLSVLLFYDLYRNRLGWASGWAFLMPLTKPAGIFAIVPFGIYIFQQRTSENIWRKMFNRKMLYACTPMLSLLLSMLHMKIAMGNWFEHFDAEKLYIAQYSISKIFDLPAWFFENFVHIKLSWHGMTNSLFDRIMFLFYLILLWCVFKRKDNMLFSYAFCLGMVPALSDHFMSYSRFLILIFPLYIELALSRIPHLYMQFILLSVQIYLLTLHSLYYWVA